MARLKAAIAPPDQRGSNDATFTSIGADLRELIGYPGGYQVSEKSRRRKRALQEVRSISPETGKDAFRVQRTSTAHGKDDNTHCHNPEGDGRYVDIPVLRSTAAPCTSSYLNCEA